MEFKIQSFADLSVYQLQQIYQLRVAVFVVEQNCAYQEVDEIDVNAQHVWLEENGQILAYLRLYRLADGLHLGRVLVAPTYRKQGLAKELLGRTLTFIQQQQAPTKVQIAAQSYLLLFYQSFGFQEVSIPYLEDGIEHVDMCLSIG